MESWVLTKASKKSKVSEKEKLWPLLRFYRGLVGVVGGGGVDNMKGLD